MISAGSMTLHMMHKLTAELGTFAHHGVVALLRFLQELPSGRLMGLACFSIILGIVLRYFLHFDPTRRMNLPPGPRPWPLIGNLFVFIDVKKSSFVSIQVKLAELASKYGPMMTIWIGGRPTVIFTGVQLTRDAFLRKAGIFSGRPVKYSWQFFTDGQRTLVTTQHNAYWQRLRKIYTKRLLSPEVIRTYAAVRMSEIERVIEALWRAEAKSQGVGFDPAPLIREQMSRIIMRMTFGDEFDAEVQKIPMGPGGSLIRRSVYMDQLCQRYLTITAGSIAHLVDYMPSFRHLQSSKDVYANYTSLEAEVKDWLLPLVQACRKEIDTQCYKSDPSSRENFIDVLLSMEGEEKFADIEVVWILVELIMGSIDTTTTSTQWSLAFCLAYPEAQRNVYEEIVSVVGYERAVVEADLPNLPYLQAFVKEVLRMKPVVALGIPHTTTQDCQLAGYNIPAKTDVMIHLEKLCNDESIWDSPSNFCPERFMNLNETQKQAWIPFGLGKRICPGMYIGQLQVQITLGNLVQRFEWISGGASGGTIDLSERLHFIIVPSSNLCASIRERRKPSPASILAPIEL